MVSGLDDSPSSGTSGTSQKKAEKSESDGIKDPGSNGHQPSDKEVREYAAWLGMDLEKDADLLWIARQGLLAPLPAPWKHCESGDGEMFYFNPDTGQSTWDHPCDDALRQTYAKEKQRKKAVDPPALALAPLASDLASTLSSKKADGLGALGLLGPLPPLRSLENDFSLASTLKSGQGESQAAGEAAGEAAGKAAGPAMPSLGDLSELMPEFAGLQEAPSPSKPAAKVDAAAEPGAAPGAAPGAEPGAEPCAEKDPEPSEPLVPSSPTPQLASILAAELQSDDSHELTSMWSGADDRSKSARGGHAGRCHRTESPKHIQTAGSLDLSSLSAVLEQSEAGACDFDRSVVDHLQHAGSGPRGSTPPLTPQRKAKNNRSPPCKPRSDGLGSDLALTPTPSRSPCKEPVANQAKASSDRASASTAGPTRASAPASSNPKSSQSSGTAPFEGLQSATAEAPSQPGDLIGTLRADSHWGELQRVQHEARASALMVEELKSQIAELSAKLQPGTGTQRAASDASRTLQRASEELQEPQDANPRHSATSSATAPGPVDSSALERTSAGATEQLLRDARGEWHREQELHAATKAQLRESRREVQSLRAQLGSRDLELERSSSATLRCQGELAERDVELHQLRLQLQARDAELSQMRAQLRAQSQQSESTMQRQRFELDEREQIVKDRERFLDERERIAMEVEAGLHRQRREIRASIQRAELADLRVSLDTARSSVEAVPSKQATKDAPHRSSSGPVGVAQKRSSSVRSMPCSRTSFEEAKAVRRECLQPSGNARGDAVGSRLLEASIRDAEAPAPGAEVAASSA
eukprot:CAMPEP_0170600240 /NCGR_PEP_ID=MMETSP0224-20130122/17230_1 /TAXON_ID=285029 /ORGANISM="Togula jolla, Strain CCCM 725" /LENGTH=814 /DNA_ID=CAMNT_0010924955 /DNA_START=70 /DNA_END=2511 /DNA_ORIENTATION=-